MTKELIDLFRWIVLPTAGNWLKDKNYEGMGKTDKEEFKRDFGEILDLAAGALWIPCSERMPEERDAKILKNLGVNMRSDYVLVTVEVKGERWTDEACTYDGKWQWSKKSAFPGWKIVAWMPKPEPYKEVDK